MLEVIMKTIYSFQLVLILVFSITESGYARIINVPEDFETIQGGIDAAEDRDTVLVQPGIYQENINYNSMNIVIGSLFLTTGNEDFIAQTVIDGAGQDVVIVMFENQERHGSVLAGFTIQNGGIGIVCWHASPTILNCIITGNSSDQSGGGIRLSDSRSLIENCLIIENSANGGAGIYLHQGSDALIRNCSILENQSTSSGGGLYIWRSEPIIEDCVISGNSTDSRGAGIYCREANPRFIRCLITDHTVDIERESGAGMYCRNESRPILEGCVFSGNSAANGGGIWMRDRSYLTVRNCTFFGNHAESGSGSAIDGFDNSSMEIVNSIFWNNNAFSIDVQADRRATISFSDIENGQEDVRNLDMIEWGEGNIDVDPQFVDAEEGDYHLTIDSHCIDTGDPEAPEDPDGTRADIGAFYYHQFILPPDIDVETDIIEFPLIEVGNLDEVIITIRNLGDDTLRVSDQTIEPEESPFFITEGIGSFQLEQNATHETTIRFEPIEEGEFEAVFRIVSNDRQERVIEIPITGTAVLMVPDIEVDADSLYYGNLDLGVIAEMEVTIFSVGNAPLLISDQYIEPDDGWFYIRTREGGFELEPDSTHETIIVFAPREYGEFEALYVIESDDPDEEIIEIPLTGYVLSVESDESELPVEFGIHSIYPNPFNNKMQLTFGLPGDAFVTVGVYDVTGRKVIDLVHGSLKVGYHTTVWNAGSCKNGIYIVYLKLNGWVDNRKIVLVK